MPTPISVPCEPTASAAIPWPLLAAVAYRAYGEATGGQNFRGEPMPDWDALPPGIRLAWEVAARAVCRCLEVS